MYEGLMAYFLIIKKENWKTNKKNFRCFVWYPVFSMEYYIWWKVSAFLVIVNFRFIHLLPHMFDCRHVSTHVFYYDVKLCCDWLIFNFFDVINFYTSSSWFKFIFHHYFHKHTLYFQIIAHLQCFILFKFLINSKIWFNENFYKLLIRHDLWYYKYNVFHHKRKVLRMRCHDANACMYYLCMNV